MKISSNAPLDLCNTLALPARALALATVDVPGEVPVALREAARQGLDVLPLGQGSNVVLAGDIEAMVLRLRSRGIETLERDEGRVLLRVAAGEDWHGFVSWSLGEGYFGLENLALIPGTVGAAPIQNIGAYGVELGRYLRAVEGVRLDTGDTLRLTREECRLGYRDSIFKHAWRDRFLITSVDLELELTPRVEVSYPALADYLRHRDITNPGPIEVFNAVVDIRRSRLPEPVRQPNAGSFFKNPVLDRVRAQALLERFPGLPAYPQAGAQVKLAAAWMIEHCGWKGRRVGAVGVHAEHALVLVNHGGGTGVELLALAARIRDSVREAFGVELEVEPRIYGART